MKTTLSENKMRFKVVQKMRAQLGVSTNFLTVLRMWSYVVEEARVTRGKTIYFWRATTTLPAPWKIMESQIGHPCKIKNKEFYMPMPGNDPGL